MLRGWMLHAFWFGVMAGLGLLGLGLASQAVQLIQDGYLSLAWPRLTLAAACAATVFLSEDMRRRMSSDQRR